MMREDPFYLIIVALALGGLGFGMLTGYFGVRYLGSWVFNGIIALILYTAFIFVRPFIMRRAPDREDVFMQGIQEIGTMVRNFFMFVLCVFFVGFCWIGSLVAGWMYAGFVTSLVMNLWPFILLLFLITEITISKWCEHRQWKKFQRERVAL